MKLQEIKEQYFPAHRSTGRERLVALLEKVQADMRAENLCTGYQEFDEIVGRLVPGSVLTIIGCAGTKKSMLASNIIVNHLNRNKDYAVMFVSAEMPATLAFERMTRQRCGLTESQYSKAVTEDESLPEDWLTLFNERCDLYDKGPSPKDIRERKALWEQTNKREIKIIVIDYLQYLQPEPGEKPYQKTSRLTREIKELAKATDCLIVMLSQVRRRGKDDSQYRAPGIEHARDSGTIEENADSLVSIWLDKDDKAILHFKSLKVRSGGRQGDDGHLIFNPITLRIESPEENKIIRWGQEV
jgi:replicative DNA helicase